MTTKHYVPTVQEMKQLGIPQRLLSDDGNFLWTTHTKILDQIDDEVIVHCYNKTWVGGDKSKFTIKVKDIDCQFNILHFVISVDNFIDNGESVEKTPKTKPTLIFDVDGVLINWMSQLPIFVRKYGIDPATVLKQFTAPSHLTASELFGISDSKIALEMIYRYNEEHGKYLTAFPDAVEHIHKLAKKYDLVALTKFGKTTDLWLIRNLNLETYFPNMFSELISIDLSESKIPYVKEIISRKHVVGFIDDQLENINDIKSSCDIPTVFLNRYDERSVVKTISDIEAHLEM